MACATLKRTLDWDAINQRPTKRRRCNFLGQTNCNGSPSSRSSLSTAAAGNDGPHSPSSRCIRETVPSPFAEANASNTTPDKMSQNIRNEIKRLHKRKQLPFTAAAIEHMQDSESSGSEMAPDSPRCPDSPPSAVRNPDKALFTFKQVQLICERMLKDREDELREKYDAVLTTKLAEQYDAFVKFTYDQIQRRYEAAPSYLS